MGWAGMGWDGCVCLFVGRVKGVEGFEKGVEI